MISDREVQPIRFISIFHPHADGKTNMSVFSLFSLLVLIAHIKLARLEMLLVSMGTDNFWAMKLPAVFENLVRGFRHRVYGEAAKYGAISPISHVCIFNFPVAMFARNF